MHDPNSALQLPLGEVAAGSALSASNRSQLKLRNTAPPHNKVGTSAALCLLFVGVS